MPTLNDIGKFVNDVGGMTAIAVFCLLILAMTIWIGFKIIKAVVPYLKETIDKMAETSRLNAEANERNAKTNQQIAHAIGKIDEAISKSQHHDVDEAHVWLATAQAILESAPESTRPRVQQHIDEVKRRMERRLNQ